MKLARLITALLLSLAIPLPALAQTHVIAELGTAPLIGRIASTSQLQGDVARQSRLFRTAGTKLGLTPAQYAQLASRIESRQLTYVTIPRRLDAMTWSSGGRVYVLRDVVIPANTKGWEVDLRDKHQVIALFIPNRCGNLSIVRKPLPAVAKAPAPRPKPPVAVAAVATAPPAPTATPAPVMPVAVALPAPAATPAPYRAAATATPAVHHANLWPLLLIPIVALLVSGHHAGAGMPAATTALSVPPAAPTPPPASCATPAPH